MNIDTFLQEIREIDWLSHSKGTESGYHIICSVFEAYDNWNGQMLKVWKPQTEALEAAAVKQIGDKSIDEIFAAVSCEIGDILREKWGRFISENSLEEEIGLDCEMTDMIKRDVAWACVERMLDIHGFFSELLEIYKSGYFPCSWLGEYPDGQAAVL